jgi:hypothetical protein
VDWLNYAAIASLLAVATVAGGSAVRLVVAAGDLRAAATVGLVAVFLAVAIAAGARGRRWRHNPYW